MPTTFRIQYPTEFGQDVQIDVEGTPQDLRWLGGGWWGATIDVSSGTSYRYRLLDGGGLVAAESADRRVPVDAAVVDRWRDPDPNRLARHSALFSRALAARHPAAAAAARSPVRLRLHEPWIPSGMTPAVLGATPQLGEWDPTLAQPMAPCPFPQWEVGIDSLDGAAEYKYVLLDESGQVAFWESGANRELPRLTGPAVVNDDGMRGLTPWRGAGVAIPVFSLRTGRSVGAGQFTDLIPLADWARDVGLSVIQLLPVNDTVLRHDWDDSYPYNPVSVHALHPLFVDLDAIPDNGIEREIAAARAKLSGAAEIDYLAVIEAKTRLLRLAYANVAASLDGEVEFAEFVEAAWDWLGPYAAWCLQRDGSGIPDPADSGSQARFDAAHIDAMASPGSPDFDELRFYWFVQYHLHRQLNHAAAEVRARGVALKGDLPIGVAPQSVEVWTHPELFHVGTQTGAPPDAFATHGQNWGFPTYDWDRMAEDGYRWWQDRFRAFAEYVDVYRIDHVLGFFRIWEIPADGYDGLVGHFRPSLPLDPEELQIAVASDDLAAFTEPWVDDSTLERFGPHRAVVDEFFVDDGSGGRLDPYTQMAIRRAFEAGVLSDLDETSRQSVMRTLLDVAADVMLVADGAGFAPAIDWTRSSAYRGLDPSRRAAFDELATGFFFRRHSAQWEEQGRRTLPAVVGATDMLACGEDLGMVPDFVPRMMNEMGLLSLEIERMPKRLGELVADPAAAPYLSVVSPGTHDTSTLRQWWQEDPHRIAEYWQESLGQIGDAPPEATPKVVAALLRRQLASPAMLCIVPFSDLLAIDGDTRRPDMDAERINDPANRHNRWRYRLHLDIDELAAATSFNSKVRALIDASGRGWRRP